VGVVVRNEGDDAGGKEETRKLAAPAAELKAETSAPSAVQPSWRVLRSTIVNNSNEEGRGEPLFLTAFMPPPPPAAKEEDDKAAAEAKKTPTVSAATSASPAACCCCFHCCCFACCCLLLLLAFVLYPSICKQQKEPSSYPPPSFSSHTTTHIFHHRNTTHLSTTTTKKTPPKLFFPSQAAHREATKRMEDLAVTSSSLWLTKDELSALLTPEELGEDDKGVWVGELGGVVYMLFLASIVFFFLHSTLLLCFAAAPPHHYPLPHLALFASSNHFLPFSF
jgi:hypothetical protein